MVVFILLVVICCFALFIFPRSRDDSENDDEYLYFVKYNAGTENTTGMVPVDSECYNHGRQVTVLDNTGELAGPLICDGIRQRFEKWNTKPDGSGTDFFPGSSFEITGNTILFAIYTADPDVLGKVGPAGGWIFYDAGCIQTWGRYLEAAKKDLPSCTWDCPDLVIPDSKTIVKETAENDISNIITADSEPGNAMIICRQYSVESHGIIFDDWNLPSRDELSLMYENLFLHGIGDFSASLYWSSSEYSEDGAWNQDFSDGNQYVSLKYPVIMRVRPVRAFTETESASIYHFDHSSSATGRDDATISCGRLLP